MPTFLSSTAERAVSPPVFGPYFGSPYIKQSNKLNKENFTQYPHDKQSLPNRDTRGLLSKDV
jgi:hypothetical protein